MEDENPEETWEEIAVIDNETLQMITNRDLEVKREVPHKDTEKETTLTKQDPRKIVPKEYHGYLSVFKEKQEPVQPPHRHHDHRIPLIDHEVPPFEPLHALDETRLQILREYLDSSVKRG
jgi:hypothetical protein